MDLNFNSKKVNMQGSRKVWFVFFTLSLLSILEVYSASSNMSYASGQFWRPMTMHSIYVVLSIVVAYLVHRLPTSIVKILLVAFYIPSILLLLLAMLHGPQINGAGRWLEFGGFSFQPSEIVKLTLLGAISFLFSAGFEKKKGSINVGWYYAAVVTTLIPVLLILKENLSTAVIIVLVVLLLTSIAKPPRRHYWGLCLFLLVFVLGGYAGMKNMPHSLVNKIDEMGLHRTSTWVNRLQEVDTLPANPYEFPVYDNLQKTHSRIAIATSGILGRGLGHSVERDFLPQAYSDFIYAIVIEELGLLPAFLVMILYLILLYSCIQIADDCKTRYARFLVMGLGLMITTQAMVNMAVATGAMPVTGQPLPLMSKGGSSMVVTGVYIGVILGVSRSIKNRKEKQELEQTNAIEK